MAVKDSSTDCLFCQIVQGDFGTEFVAESELSIAFRDLEPQAPTHVLVVPRRHLAALHDLGPHDGNLAADMLRLAVAVARTQGILREGYRVVTNDGPNAGQSVPHLHWHVLGGRALRLPLG